MFNDDEKFLRNGDNGCGKCPKMLNNLIRLCGVAIAFLIWIEVLVILNVRKKRDSDMSILFRIASNYFQMLAITMSFSFKWPDFISSA